MRLFLFEDQRHTSFFPLTLTRPVWDLRVGFLTLAEKWALEFSGVEIHGEIRDSLSGVFDSKVYTPSAVSTSKIEIRVNSRYLPTDSLARALKLWAENPNQITEFLHEDKGEKILVAKAIPDGYGEHIASNVTNDHSKGSIQASQVFLEDVHSIHYPWDLLSMNGEEIQNDVKRLKRNGWHNQGRMIVDENGTSNADEVNGFVEFSSGIQPGFHSNAFVDEPAALFMHPSAIVEPGVTIQTTEGPVVIGEGALIMAGSHLKGPLAISEGAIVKMGALLYKNSTIGPYSKVGGEVSNCIFHSYSNKAHHGYAGNSIFGQWVNLGAGTTTSNLRGNYGEVRVRDWVSGEELKTGRQFLGSIMGDHVKTGINTILNTGTIVGPSSMIFGAGFAPKWIHSFSWINSDTGEVELYDVEKSLIDMHRMMSRRDVKLTDSYADMMRGISKRK